MYNLFFDVSINVMNYANYSLMALLYTFKIYSVIMVLKKNLKNCKYLKTVLSGLKTDASLEEPGFLLIARRIVQNQSVNFTPTIVQKIKGGIKYATLNL